MANVRTLFNHPAGHFARHYVEMVVAMFLG